MALPQRIFSGAGCLSQLRDVLPVGDVLVMTGEGLALTPMFAEVKTALGNARVITLPEREPRISDAQTALEAARVLAPSVIVGVGGGSVLDVAKTVAVLLHSRLTVREALGNSMLTREVYFAAVPTTAGTGSETTQNALFIDDADGVKRAVISPACIPDAVVLDALLTVGLPARATAFTGVDALCHCAESYLSVRASFLSRAYSEKGLRLILDTLESAVRIPENLEARQAMLEASFLGGAALALAGTTAVHALAYSLGKRGVPHGVANSLLFEKVMRLSLQRPEDEIPYYRELVSLIQRLPIPSLAEYGVRKEECAAMADEAMLQTRLLRNHPADVDVGLAKRIFEELFA